MVVRDFAGVVEAEGLLDEPAFAFESVAFELDAEGLAEDFDGVGVSVQGAADGGDHMLVFAQAQQGVLDDRFAGAGHAEHQAQSALLTMDFQRVVNLLLRGQQFEFTSVEGVGGQAPEGSDHDCSFRRKSPLATASSRRAWPMRWPLW